MFNSKHKSELFCLTVKTDRGVFWFSWAPTLLQGCRKGPGTYWFFYLHVSSVLSMILNCCKCIFLLFYWISQHFIIKYSVSLFMQYSRSVSRLITSSCLDSQLGGKLIMTTIFCDKPSWPIVGDPLGWRANENRQTVFERCKAGLRTFEREQRRG